MPRVKNTNQANAVWERFKAWVAEVCVLRDTPCRSCCVQLCLDSAFQRQKMLAHPCVSGWLPDIFIFRRKDAHCIKRILSRSRLFSATCSCMWSLLMRWPDSGEFCSLVAHSSPSSISQAILIGLQIVADRKSSPSPLRGPSAWNVQKYRRISTF